jgi:hypothetical protein
MCSGCMRNPGTSRIHFLGQRDHKEALYNCFSLPLTIFTCNPRFSIREKPMNNLKSVLYAAVLVSLFCVLAPCAVQAQDDGPVPWKRRGVIIDNGPAQPLSYLKHIQDDGSIPPVSFALAEDSSSKPQHFNGPVQEDFFVPRPYNTVAGSTSTTGDKFPNRHVLFEDRRTEYAWLRS